MNAGKAIRWKHIFRDDGKAVIVAMDHSMRGKVPGLEDYLATIKKVAAGGADATLIGYGNLLALAEHLPRNLGWIVSIPYPPRPEFVKEAAKAGADALKFTHFGGLRDLNLNSLQPIAAACEEHGIVFMPEVVPRMRTATSSRIRWFLQLVWDRRREETSSRPPILEASNPSRRSSLPAPSP